MKNSKVTKLLILAISLVLLIGSVVGISVSAADGDEDYTYEIPMINISHGASSSMLFAVDAPIEDAADGKVIVTYSYYLGAEKINAVAAYSADITAEAKMGMPVFYTVGISPKDQGEEITVEAHKVSAPEDFVPLYYSTTIGKYLYSKLYRDGLVYSDNANDKKLAKMYLAQIEYVSMAQDALWNADHPDSVRPLLNSYKYVAIKDGKIAATGNSHDLIAGDTVTVAYTGTDAAPVGWDVTTYDADGKSTVTFVGGNKIPLTASSVLTPFVDPDMITFENLDLGKLPVDGGNKAIYSQNDALRLYGSSVGNIAEVVSYNNVNKGFKVDGGKYLWMYAKNYNVETHNVSLLEFDLNTLSMSASGAEVFYFRNPSFGSTDVFKLEIRQYGTGLAFRISGNAIGTGSYTNFTSDVVGSFHIKLEFYWLKGALKLTIDGKEMFNDIVSSSTVAIERNYYVPNANNDVILDNIKQVSTYVDPSEFNLE